jgi:hypothetical protein
LLCKREAFARSRLWQDADSRNIRAISMCADWKCIENVISRLAEMIVVSETASWQRRPA